MIWDLSADTLATLSFVAGTEYLESFCLSLGSYAIDFRSQGFNPAVVSQSYRGFSLVIRLLHDEDRELRFWFEQLPELRKIQARGL